MMSPAGLTFDGSRAVQVDEFVRGDYPQFRDRGNKATTISFSVTRMHNSYGEAEIFCLEHENELPIVDDLSITGVKSNGGTIRRIAKKAALQNVRSQHRAGVTTVHSYQFLVGELVTAK